MSSFSRTVVVASAALALAFAIACSSFGSDDPPPTAATDDGGSDAVGDSLLPDGAQVVAPCNSVKVASDPDHCGKCGHSCLGGACTGGVCQPVEVGRSDGTPVVDVAVDGANVYWLTSTSLWAGPGALYACPRSGCTSTPKSLTGSAETGSLGGDGNDTYASLVYGDRKLGRVGANGLSPIQAINHASAVRLQVVEKRLYYLALGEPPSIDPGQFSGTVFGWDGVNERELATFAGKENLYDLVVTGTHLFLSGYAEIVTCELGDCLTRKPFFSDPGNGSINIVTDGKQLFWRNDASQVFSCGVAGPCKAPTPVLGPAQIGTANLRGLSFARGKLYISTSNDDIFECDPAGCPPNVKPRIHGGPLFVGSEDNYGHGVTADDEAIYWTEVVPGPSGDAADVPSGTHRLMKLAK